jgi:hypothetical protein
MQMRAVRPLMIQKIRGTWSGLLGMCVFEPTDAARSKSASSILGAITAGECVPVVGDNGQQVLHELAWIVVF